MKRPIPWLAAAAAAAIVVWPLISARSQQPQAGETASQDAQAVEVLERLQQYLGDRQSVSVDLRFETRVEGIELPALPEHAVRVRYAAPNRLAVVTEQPDAGRLMIVSDGQQMYSYASALQRYTVEPAADDVASVENPLLQSIRSGPPAAAFPAADLVSKVTERARALRYEGTEELDGVECHKLKLVLPESETELWVSTGERPLPRQAVVDMSRQVQAQLGPDVRLQMVLSYDDWKVDYEPGPGTFAFEPPPMAELVDSLFTVDRGADPQQLVGQAAPQFELELLDGGQFQLAELQGESIVILDFWATWCGPCVRALPIISRVAEQFEDQGVKFIAVDIGEEDEQVRQFLQDHELEITVAMDRDGAVAQQYLAMAIPQTVIIGRDGTVQVVHLGVSDDLEQRLTQELQALVDGQTLAEPSEP